MSGLEGRVEVHSPVDSGRGREVLTVVSFGLVVFAFFLWRILFSFDHILLDNVVFGADHAENLRSVAFDDSGALRPEKHELAVVWFFALVRSIALFLPPLLSAKLVFALTAALAGVSLLVLLRRFGVERLNAICAALFVLSSFAVITIFSLAETYALTCTMISLSIIAFLEMGKHAEDAPWKYGALAGLAAGLAGLANSPALAVILVYPILRRGPKLLPDVIVPILVAGLLTVAVSIVQLRVVEWQLSYLDRYASWSNFGDTRIVLDYLASVFLFAWTAPVDMVKTSYESADLESLLTSPLRLAALALSVATVVAGVVTAIRFEQRGAATALLASVGPLLLFYLYFNPQEAMLYASQWVWLFGVVAALGLNTRRGAIAFAGCAALNFAVNAPVLFA